MIRSFIKRWLILLVLMFSLSLSAQTDQQVYDELKKYNVKYPQIVLAQAKLETGNYTSTLCKKHGNLFGLKRKGGYVKFNNWRIRNYFIWLFNKKYGLF